MKSVVGKKVVKISDLKFNFFVRKELNQDHVLYLAELLEAGEKLPPILVTRDLEVIDGRHRIEAHSLLDRNEIEAQVVDVSDESEKIALAYRSNAGGSLPPTQADTEFTIQQLVALKLKTDQIADLLQLPVSMIRGYVDKVRAKEKRRRALAAIDDITNGLTLEEASKKHGVRAEYVKQIISQRKKRKKEDEKIFKDLHDLHRNFSVRRSKFFERIQKLFEDGEISSSQVSSVLQRLVNFHRKSGRTLEDFKNRMEAMINKSCKKS